MTHFRRAGDPSPTVTDLVMASPKHPRAKNKLQQEGLVVVFTGALLQSLSHQDFAMDAAMSTPTQLDIAMG